MLTSTNHFSKKKYINAEENLQGGDILSDWSFQANRDLTPSNEEDEEALTAIIEKTSICARDVFNCHIYMGERVEIFIKNVDAGKD